MRPDRPTPLRWRRSGYCQTNNGCVEVARSEGPGGPSAALRDGTLPESGAVLSLTPAGWRSFLTAVRAGAFDRPPQAGPPPASSPASSPSGRAATRP
ncbi:hypothetical protein GCM10023085_55110 [Actinomadura viridis]|uniref:DUF397 domain-containing protein n=1 Tax=Actinomadura viridis TaxID=58110 RepID=A0A931DA90_9ACTN|nr:DUF397 domain-containing protein [Actinomadura viridis]MBG6086470.1 hypothetical protein [Actinomadura viridis]